MSDMVVKTTSNIFTSNMSVSNFMCYHLFADTVRFITKRVELYWLLTQVVRSLTNRIYIYWKCLFSLLVSISETL